MNTQTHLLVAAALFTQPGEYRRNTAAILGAFVPDAAIYGLWAWSKLNAIPENTVWRELYWQQPWQSYTAFGNSLPLYLIILFAGAIVGNRLQARSLEIPLPAQTAPARWRAFLHRQPLAVIFALAAMSHIASDFPVHVVDAHAHLWPLSDWRFRSPVSYWDPAHYGNWFQPLEVALGVTLAVIMFRRFRDLWVRALMLAAVAAYVAVPMYFSLIIGHH